jgi:hypothetical protein
MDRTLEVRRIFLTHTNFEEHGDTTRAVQISHASLSGEVLVNLTRSEDIVAETVMIPVVVGKGLEA